MALNLGAFRALTEFEWVSGGDVISLLFDYPSAHDDVGRPFISVKIAKATYMQPQEEGPPEEVVIDLPTDPLGERVAMQAEAEDWSDYEELEAAGRRVMAWSGVTDQWVPAGPFGASWYHALGDQQALVYLDQIAEIAEREDFRLEIECRAGVGYVDGTSREITLVAEYWPEVPAEIISPAEREEEVRLYSFDVGEGEPEVSLEKVAPVPKIDSFTHGARPAETHGFLVATVVYDPAEDPPLFFKT